MLKTYKSKLDFGILSISHHISFIINIPFVRLVLVPVALITVLCEGVCRELLGGWCQHVWLLVLNRWWEQQWPELLLRNPLNTQTLTVISDIIEKTVVAVVWNIYNLPHWRRDADRLKVYMSHRWFAVGAFLCVRLSVYSFCGWDLVVSYLQSCYTKLLQPSLCLSKAIFFGASCFRIFKIFLFLQDVVKAYKTASKHFCGGQHRAVLLCKNGEKVGFFRNLWCLFVFVCLIRILNEAAASGSCQNLCCLFFR